MKIGSFSAASNVTGMLTPVYELARIMHRHNGIVCYDFAASAPYVTIDMNRDDDSYFDALFFSPHKFLGGPGSSGLLIFNERLYHRDLPPTFGGGGTVDYVSAHSHVYTGDIEARENAGTPGTLQTIKAALALDIDDDRSERYQTLICHGYSGLKPGWVRIGFHFTHSEADFAFICDAVEFIAEYGHRFLPYYTFDVKSGAWRHIKDTGEQTPRFGLSAALAAKERHFGRDVDREREQAYKDYLDQARSLADEYSSPAPCYRGLSPELEALSFFHVQNFS